LSSTSKATPYISSFSSTTTGSGSRMAAFKSIAAHEATVKHFVAATSLSQPQLFLHTWVAARTIYCMDVATTKKEILLWLRNFIPWKKLSIKNWLRCLKKLSSCTYVIVNAIYLYGAIMWVVKLWLNARESPLKWPAMSLCARETAEIHFLCAILWLFRFFQLTLRRPLASSES
jgi:hypothetical protein